MRNGFLRREPGGGGVADAAPSPDLARTLAAYRRQKWAELQDEGPERLQRELYRLATLLDDYRQGRNGRLIEVDEEFWEGKIRVLRELLESDIPVDE